MQILSMLFPMAVAFVAVSAAQVPKLGIRALEMSGSPISVSASTATLASGPTNCATLLVGGASTFAHGLLGSATINNSALSNNSENITVVCTSCPHIVNKPLVELGPTLSLSSIPDNSTPTGVDSFPTGVDSFPTGVDSFTMGVDSVPTALGLISAEPIETVSLTTTSTIIVGRNNSYTSSSPCLSTSNSAVHGDIFSPFVDFPMTSTLSMDYSTVIPIVTVNQTITVIPIEASVSRTQTTLAPSITGGATHKYRSIFVILGMAAFALLVV